MTSLSQMDGVARNGHRVVTIDEHEGILFEQQPFKMGGYDER